MKKSIITITLFLLLFNCSQDDELMAGGEYIKAVNYMQSEKPIIELKSVVEGDSIYRVGLIGSFEYYGKRSYDSAHAVVAVFLNGKLKNLDTLKLKNVQTNDQIFPNMQYVYNKGTCFLHSRNKNSGSDDIDFIVSFIGYYLY